MAIDLDDLLVGVGAQLDTFAPPIGSREVRARRCQASASQPTGVPRAGVAVAVVVSCVMRAPMVSVPITSDEGGFLAIARAWGNGATLYDDVWVDRPQGLLVLYRWWDALAGGNVASLRILAMIAAGVLIASVASLATLMAGRRAGTIAALLCAVTVSSPAIEGHIANGELLSGAVAVAGLSVGYRAIVMRTRPGLFYVSGLLAGVALSLKQSGFEGGAVVVGWLILAGSARWRAREEVVSALMQVAAGCATVITALVVHGATVGLGRWWYAVAGYRLGQRSAATGADWARLLSTAEFARPVLGPLLAVVVVGVAVRCVRSDVGQRLPASHRLALVLWVISAGAAFVSGGQFHRHYWVILCPVLSVCAAVVIARAARLMTAVCLVGLALVPALWSTIRIVRLDRADISVEASGDRRLNLDEVLARWFRQEVAPGDSVYVLCASAAFYANAGIDPPYPYVWFDNVTAVPGAQARLRSLLADDEAAPRWIVQHQDPNVCDSSGQLGQIVTDHYRARTTVGGVDVLERRDPSGGP